MLPPWFRPSRLWLVLDAAAAAPLTLPTVTALAIAGGVDVIVYRRPGLTAAEALADGRQVRDLCRRGGVPFVLSHFAELGPELAPDALHLGIADDSVRTICQSYPALPLGYSAHSAAEVQAALAEGCDYCFLGPLFTTPAKVRYGPPLGAGVLADPALPLHRIVAIGGINAATLPAALAAGAQRVAVIAALQEQPDVQAATVALRRQLRELTGS
jgi:thiamine-phosphate pyrophosphorylase